MKKGLSALQREVMELENKFAYLLEMGISFSSDKELDCLLDSILSKAKKIANCQAGSIFLVEEIYEHNEHKKMLRFMAAQNDSLSKFQLLKSAVEFTLPLATDSIAGYVAVTGNSLNIKDAYQIDKSEPYEFNHSFDNQIGFKTQSMLAMPIRDSKGETLGVLELINRIDKRALLALRNEDDFTPIMPFLPQDEETIRWVAGLAGVAVENIHMINELKDQNIKLDQMVKDRTQKLNIALNVLEKDLNTAHQMQLNIVPRKEMVDSLSLSYSLKMSSIFKPCDKLGGDFWDVVKIDDNKIGIIIIDFAGHGIAPCLNTFRIKEFFHNFARTSKSPAVLLDKMNDNVFKNYNMHATCFYAIYDKADNSFTYSRAGHPYGMWLNQKEDKMIELNVKGAALGFFPESKYEEMKITLEEGDKVILYSDGITEAENSNNEFFGESSLESILLQHKNKTALEITDAIIESFSEFTRETKLNDDITLIVLGPN